MNAWLTLPWLELAILISLVGALGVGQFRDPLRAWRWGLTFMGAVLACGLGASLCFYLGRQSGIDDRWGFQSYLLGKPWFGLDELSAPMVSLVALLHFLTALATGRTKMRRFSLTWSLSLEAVSLATFACLEPWGLVGLLAAGTVPAYLELRNRHQPTRIYLLHMGLFVALMILGWTGLAHGHRDQPSMIWATVALLTAMLIRCGSVPVHCWLTDWFEQASFGNALLFVTPLVGVYAVLRLVLPIAPEWVLQSISLFSLATAVYAAGMAVVQKEARRFFAYLCLSHASLVLVGLELHTATSLTGALALWVSAALSLSGLGLTLRALEARFGRLTLKQFQGLYDHSPALAWCFLVTGLASVGFPGTVGFVASELLVDGAVQANLFVGLAVILTAAINGIAVVRAYFCLFTGARHTSTVSLAITPREQLAVLTLLVLIFGGGLLPQPGVMSRYQAAMIILRQRELELGRQSVVSGSWVWTKGED